MDLGSGRRNRLTLLNRSKNSVSGIYAICNLVNGKRYIGQTKNLYERQCSHIGKLNRGIHANKHLQRSWNKYGANNFEFVVLEYCEFSQLNERELYWIDYYQSNIDGYNIRLDPVTNRGLKWNDAQRAKMNSIINKDGSWYKNHIIPKSTMEKAWQASRNKVWTDEERKKHSEILTGTKVSDTTKMHIAQTGENNGYAKLCQKEVEEIIYFLYMKYRVRLISRVYHIKETTISAIKHYRSWLNISRSGVLENPKVKYRAFDRLNDFILKEM